MDVVMQDDPPRARLFLFEWLGFYVVTDEPGNAWGIIAARAIEETEETSDAKALFRFAELRTGAHTNIQTRARADTLVGNHPILGNLRWYLRAVDPGDVVEVPLTKFPDHARPVTNWGWVRDLHWSGSALELPDIVGAGWTFDTHGEP